MTLTPQRARALKVANRKRMDVRHLRQELVADPRRLQAVLLDPPACLAGMLLLDVVCLPGRGRRPSSATDTARLGRAAIRDDINLLVTIDRAPLRVRRWVADHATWVQRNNGWGLSVTLREVAAA